MTRSGADQNEELIAANGPGRVLLTARFGLLKDSGADRLLTVAIVLMLVCSRWAAFPASIWDQDEAHMAAGVLHFDPLHNQPHPPFFPGWIALGKVVLTVMPQLSPSAALQLVSAVVSVWMVFPLVALWSLLLPRRQAVLAALLFELLPLPWLLAGRAYCGTVASALLVAAAACWLRREVDGGRLVLGSALLAAAVLVRPHLLVVAALLAVWQTTVRRGRRVLIWVVPLLAGLVAGAVLVHQAGGVTDLAAAVRRHAGLHLGQLHAFSWSVRELGLVQAVGGEVAGWAWAVAAVAGALVLVLEPRSRQACLVLVGLVVLPLVVLVIAVHNPTLVRYAVVYLALTSGLVVAAAWRACERLRLPGEALFVALVPVVLVTAPHLGAYREQPSPVVQALAMVEDAGPVDQLVADESLAPFIALRQLEHRLHAEVHPLAALTADVAASPQRTRLVALFVGGSAESGDRPCTEVRATDPLLRRLASPRLLDLVRCEGTASLALSLGNEPGAVVLALPRRGDGAFIGAAVAGGAVEAGPVDLGAVVGGELVIEAAELGQLQVLAADGGSPWAGYTLLGARDAVLDLGQWPLIGSLGGLAEVHFRFEAPVQDLAALLRAELVVEEDGGACHRIGLVGE